MPMMTFELSKVLASCIVDGRGRFRPMTFVLSIFDPYSRQGKLTGLLIEALSFPAGIASVLSSST